MLESRSASVLIGRIPCLKSSESSLDLTTVSIGLFSGRHQIHKFLIKINAGDPKNFRA